MPIKVSGFSKTEKVTQVTWEGDTMDVGYNPHAVTLEVIDLIANAETLEGVAVQLSKVLVWWDLLDDKGKRLPTDLATMRSLPVNFLLKVMDDVTEDSKVDEGEGEG